MSGKFVISLDFELLWGVRDQETVASYGRRLMGVWETLPATLRLFESHQIKATFATVGFLFAENLNELMPFVPELKPSYGDANLSPYAGHFDSIDDSDLSQKCHFCKPLLELISSSGQHEVATHTFAHFYCREPSQSVAEFDADLTAACAIADANSIALKSIVFPRNQYDEEYLRVCHQHGIHAFRGTETSWLYRSSETRSEQALQRKIGRMIDAYLNVSGHHIYSLDEMRYDLDGQLAMVNVPSSRFLRPYSSKLGFLEPLRFRRIKNAMTKAAKTNKVFHLWWHPHNFGGDQAENLEMLQRILKHFTFLNETFGFESATMSDVAEEVLAD